MILFSHECRGSLYVHCANMYLDNPIVLETWDYFKST